MRHLLVASLVAVAAAACGSSRPAAPTTTPADPLVTTSAAELFEQGKSFGSRGDYIRAEQYLTAAIRSGYSSRVVMPLLVSFCIQGGRYQSALVHARGELERRPQDWRLRYVVGTLYEGLGQHSAAQREYRRAIADNPGFADAHYSLAVLLVQRGQSRSAEGHFRRYLELEPDGAHAYDARAHLASDRQPEDEALAPVEVPAADPADADPAEPDESPTPEPRRRPIRVHP